MDERVIRGVPWTLVSYAGSKLVAVATTIVLARLLSPDDFGIVAIAIVLVTALNVLSDFGLVATLILRQELDRRAQGTILTLMVALSVALGGVLALTAPYLADFFAEPRLASVLIVLSPGVVISAWAWFYEALLQRELEFKRRFGAIALQSAATALTAVSLALAGAGVWSLVAGQLVGLAVFAGVLMALAPYRVPLCFDRHSALDCLHTGRGFVVQHGAAFTTQNLDYLVVGRFLGIAQTGFYSMAYRLSELPYWAIADPVARVTFPGFAQMRHRREDVTGAYLTGLRLVAFVACPFGALLSAVADPFTRAVLGPDWVGMIGALSVLGAWAALRPIQGTVSSFLNSVGEADVLGGVTAALVLPFAAGLVLAGALGDIVAVAWVMVADVTVAVLVVIWLVQRRAGVSGPEHWRALRAVGAGCIGGWLAARGVLGAAADLAPALELALAASAGGLAYLVTVRVLDSGLLQVARTQIGRALARERP